MEESKFEHSKLIAHWMSGSDDDFDTMMVMYKAKKYSWALFIGHLSMEKLLKAHYISVILDNPPFTHNLLRLAEKSGLKLDEKLIKSLVTVTAFNINARYDDYKSSFKQQCTHEFTKFWVEEIQHLRLWIKKQIKL